MAAIRHLGDVYDMLNDEFIFKNKDCCFRGQSDGDYKVWPSVFRKYARYQATSFFLPSLENFIKERRLPYQFTDNLIEKMGIAQHFEVPTKLLDWSNDPLIALFFACSSKEKMDKDGAIFCLDKVAFPSYDPEFVPDADCSEDNLVFVRQTIGNPRIRAQSGCFLYWLKPILNDPKYSFDLVHYLETKEKSASLRKKIIKSEDKKMILLLLEKHYGISRENLFFAGEKIKEAKIRYENLFTLAQAKAHGFTTYLSGPIEKSLVIPESEINQETSAK